MATASRRLRATDLNAPSAMWWLFSPASFLMCSVMFALRTKPSQNSLTSSASNAPIFCVGISRS